MFRILGKYSKPTIKHKHRNLLNPINTTIYFGRKDKDRTEQSPIESSLNRNQLFSLFHSFPEKSGTYFSFFSGENCFRRASITMEAAIVVPMFLFLCFLMLYPMKIMESERKLQNQMENIGKQFAVVEYAKVVGTGMLKKDSSIREFMDNTVPGLEEGAGLAAILAQAVGGPFENLRFSQETAVFSKEEGADSTMFFAELEYEADMPFSEWFPMTKISKSLVVNRRAWVGSNGGRGRSKYGEELEEDEESDERMVYLGKNSTVYHDDPNCHYLSNVTYSADVSAMKELRNEGGDKYHACPSCKPGTSGTVYYFANGTAYHSSDHCKAITAYARAVPFAEADGMRACSYCGKGHKGDAHEN